MRSISLWEKLVKITEQEQEFLKDEFKFQADLGKAIKIYEKALIMGGFKYLSSDDQAGWVEFPELIKARAIIIAQENEDKAEIMRHQRAEQI